MSEHIDLEATISDAVNDAQIDDTPEVASDAPVVEEAVSETPAESVEAAAESTEEAPAESAEVASPAADKVAEPAADQQDDFAKLAGVAPVGVGGRENRIPYSRVKKITEKAVSEVAEAALGRKLNPGEKAIDVVKAHVAQLPELQSKVTDYESRLEAVGQFEEVMANDPQKFFTMLARIPAYKEFFEFLDQANAVMAQQAQGGNTPAVAPAQAATPDEAMPEPDEEMPDGSKVYSMEGLQKLLEWNAAKVEARVASKYEGKLSQLEERYKPIESEWQERRRIEATLPVIRKQIEEARTWHLFNESEDEILAALKADPKISLERAYQQVVFPKLVAERTKVKQEVIKELKQAPTSTSVPSRAASKPAPAANGPRSLEDIIREQVETVRR